MPLTIAERAELALLEREIALIHGRLISAAEEAEIARCAADPWYWLQNYVTTLDEVDLIDPLKRFPDYEYCHDIVRCWMAYPDYRLFVLEKSRRMLVTLTVVALLLHDAQFGDGRQNFIVSQNEAKADNQIQRRAKIMYDNQPDFLRAAFPAKAIECYMIFPGQDKADKFGIDKSKLRKRATCEIWSVPQKGEQIRGETPSNVLFDEVVAQSEAESNYNALKPALEAGKKHGARFWAVSTAGIGFFDRLVHDRL